MTKFAIKAVNGKYIKMTADDVAVNEQHMTAHGTVRLGAVLTKAAYNYKTHEQAERALAVINEYVKQNRRTEDERKAVAKDWRYTQYVDAQVGCYIEEL
jgi:hypothetical protein